MGMFERRHYQAIAEVLVHRYEFAYAHAMRDIREVANDLADMFELDNPNFEREEFLKACGMEEG